MPTALDTTYCDSDDVAALLSSDGRDLALDDDGSGTVSAGELAYLTGRGISYATSRVNFYCQGLYEPADLATSWLVNEWATIIAARWVRSRRCNPVPTALQELYEEAIKDLAAVRSGAVDIPDIGKRGVDWPAWSNVRKDERYRLRQLRVERPLSENTPTQYPQKIDRQAEWIFEI